MRYRKLDGNGDMTFGNQQADFYRDVPDAPGQAVLTRLRLVSGEWYLDISAGVPYQGGVLGKFTKDTANPILRDAILGAQGVTSLNDYDYNFNPDTRTYTVSGNIDTVYGVTALPGVV
jgi:hypothetical protein